jgi:inner membrane protein
VQEEAIREVSAKWGERQTITGPIISIPYYDGYGHNIKFAHFLPDQLTINGEMFPERRYRSIYEVVVYNSKLKFTGSFSGIDLEKFKVPKESVLYKDAFVSLGISDLRGIEEQVRLKWNKDNYMFNPGVESNDVIGTGINAKANIQPADSTVNTFTFDFDLTLKGSEILYFVPVGKETVINIHSAWPSPSFDGAFLPDSRTIDNSGFKANWKILHLNRNYPQAWLGEKYHINDSSFGVNLLLPMDGYKKSDRTIKYAILLIGLTFIIFFFTELLNKVFIHPFQYVLIGLALVIFYTLLLSFTEHMDYNLAYTLSGAMTIGLVSIYTKSILKDKKFSALVGGTLLILYSFIFTIIQLEAYALLMGSIGLFITLAMIMYFSRKIDWVNIKRA